MILEVLVSCMNQENMTIVEKSNITTNVLIINQCEKNDFQQCENGNQIIRMISTTERGLSRSRNMAINRAAGDICLFCDDDEAFYRNYEQIILAAFHRLSNADIILFNLDNLPHSFKGKARQLKYRDLFHAMSCQIAFRKKSLEQIQTYFHPYMGAGSGNGAQEENKFLIDCYKKGLNIYYVPSKIGMLLESSSSWFNGYDEKFFYQRGGATRKMLGLPGAVLYAFYYTIRKRPIYKNDISPAKAFWATLKGCIDDPIGKQEKQSCHL